VAASPGTGWRLPSESHGGISGIGNIDIAVLHLSGDVFYGCGLSAVISRGALRQMLLIQDHTITRYLTPELCGGDSAVHVMLEST